MDKNIIYFTQGHNHHKYNYVKKFHTSQRDQTGMPTLSFFICYLIEPLAAAIRQNNNIKGIQDLNTQHKICLYADDLLLCLQDLHTSLEETFKIINTFSKISDYTINWNKSTILPLSEDAWDSTTHETSLPLHTGNITYLGINISLPDCQSYLVLIIHPS